MKGQEGGDLTPRVASVEDTVAQDQLALRQVFRTAVADAAIGVEQTAGGDLPGEHANEEGDLLGIQTAGMTGKQLRDRLASRRSHLAPGQYESVAHERTGMPVTTQTPALEELVEVGRPHRARDAGPGAGDECNCKRE